MNKLYRLRAIIGHKTIFLKKYNLIEELDFKYVCERDYVGRHDFMKENEEQIVVYGNDLEIYTLDSRKVKKLTKLLKTYVIVEAEKLLKKSQEDLSIAKNLSLEVREI
jgi:hypothetical protein